MHTSSSRRLMGRTTLEWFSSLPVFIMLMLTLVIGTGEMFHGQLLKFGESMFGDPQTNQFSVTHEPNARLVSMRESRPQRASKAIERP